MLRNSRKMNLQNFIKFESREVIVKLYMGISFTLVRFKLKLIGG